MIGAAALGLFNHLLSQQTWARRRLAAHADALASVDLAGSALRFTVREDGYVAEAAADGEPAVTISVPAAALAELLEGTEALMSQVRIEGNADFAESLGFVFRHLEWDSEADLARVFGPILGRRIDLTGRRVARAAPELGGRLARNAAEYLVNENPLLVDRTEATDFVDRLRVLRDDMARLDKRIARLHPHPSRTPE